MAKQTKKTKRKVGRPKTIDGDTIVVTYNVTVEQANFIVDQATENGVTESEIMRGLIDYVRAQYRKVGRA